MLLAFPKMICSFLHLEQRTLTNLLLVVRLSVLIRIPPALPWCHMPAWSSYCRRCRRTANLFSWSLLRRCAWIWWRPACCTFRDCRCPGPRRAIAPGILSRGWASWPAFSWSGRLSAEYASGSICSSAESFWEFSWSLLYSTCHKSGYL